MRPPDRASGPAVRTTSGPFHFLSPAWPRAGLLALILAAFASAPASPAADLTTRHRVLVYYANETSPKAAQSPNYATLLAVLDRSASPRAKYAADSIRLDARKMPALVDRDVTALIAQAKRLGFDLAIFTNRLAFEQRYLLYRRSVGAIEARRLPPLPTAAGTILATSPLAQPEALRAALGEVAAQYPSKSLDMVLIADSHGSGEMAMIPRVNADLSKRGSALALREMLESDDQGVPPDWAVLQGTSKRMFWAILGDLSATRGVRFPLIFREACASGLRTFPEYFAVPASVGLIAHSAMGPLEATDISYTAILARATTEADWVTVLASGLHQAGIHVNGRYSIWLWVLLVRLGLVPPWLYFTPLALWVVWYAWSRRHTRAGRD